MRGKPLLFPVAVIAASFPQEAIVGALLVGAAGTAGNGSFPVEITEILEGEHSVVVLARSTASREGRILDQPYAHIFHFRGDQVSEAWVVNYDQARTDAFWS